MLLSCTRNLHTSLHLTYRRGNVSSVTNAVIVPENWLVSILEACEGATKCVIPRSFPHVSVDGGMEHQLLLTPSCTKMIPESTFICIFINL